MGSFVVLQIFVVVLALSTATTMFNKRVFGLPQAIGSPIAGALCVIIFQFAAIAANSSDYIHINIESIRDTVTQFDLYNFLINGVICFILTTSAITYKISDLKQHWQAVSILATIALALCAFLFASILYQFHIVIGIEVPFLILLLLGSALGATDAIGIKGVLSSLKAPSHIYTKSFGESLFNDAMCIALFMTILGLIGGKTFSIGGIAYHLAYEIVVATAIGLGAGWICLRLLRGPHERESLILLIGLLACSSYLIALYVHASAPIASVVAGLYVGNKWGDILSWKSREDINQFWHTIEGLINTFLFAMIGFELFIIDIDFMLVACGVVAFVVLHLSRIIANGISFAFFPHLMKKRFNGSLMIVSWGGVRGAISLALVLAVCNTPELKPYANILIGYTFFSVLLSGVVCGLGLPGVINAFYHNPNAPTTGFSGWYQRMCNKLNTKGFKYTVTEDAVGNEMISIYTPNSASQATKEDSEHSDRF